MAIIVKVEQRASPTPTTTPTPTPTPTQTIYTVYWTYTLSTTSGTCQISKNGVNQVNISSSSSGSFTYSSGDYIEVYVDTTSSFLVARSRISVTDNSGTIYNSYSDGSPYSSLATPILYPVGTCYIDAYSEEY